MNTKDSPCRVGGTGSTPCQPREQTNAIRNVTANPAVATNPNQPAPTAPELETSCRQEVLPLPEHVKAAHRRKLALATAKQAGAQTQPDPSTPGPASTVPETCPEPRLAELEAIVEKGLTTFIEVGNALAEIRDSRLYRQAFETFEDYCRERWAMSRVHAHRMIEAAGVASNLLPVGNIQPTTERQVRPLAGLEPEQQREAWKAATETSPNPTADHVARVAKTITTAIEDARVNTTGGTVSQAPKQPTKPPKPPKPSKDATPPEYCEVGWILHNGTRFGALGFDPGKREMEESRSEAF